MKNIINIINEQDVILVNDEIENIIKNAIEQAILFEGHKTPFEINVLLVDNLEIKMINFQNRDIDSDTDVLSFPMLCFDEKNKIIDNFGDGDYNKDNNTYLLGDIVISLEKAATQATDFGHSFQREVGFLTVHSMLHLFGFDHTNEKDTKIMREKEEMILGKINLFR